MAFEFHDKRGDSSCDDYVVECLHSPGREEILPNQFRSCSPLTKSEAQQEFQKDLLKPSSELYPKREISPNIDSVCGSGRSITDLPPALVSEILRSLDAKELGIVSCVSTLLHRLASEHQGWKIFYCERWGLPFGPMPLGSGFVEGKSWKDLFVERECRSRTFLGRFSIDILYGHTEAVRSVFVLSAANLIFTAGYDSVIRMWDLEEGLLIGSSQPLGCTIRAVVADSKLVAAGGTDGFIQCWKAVEELPHLFDLTGSQSENTEFRLWEHEGPVTCLALDPARIYSGSWDMTVRVWDRSLFICSKVLRHNDWVWSLVPRGSTVASTAGADVYIWDVDDGDLVAVLQNVHVGNTCCLARSHMGDLLFTGGDDGAIHMFETKKSCNFSHVATWNPHSGSVNSLAFEFPWLVSASSDGKLSLIDIRKLLKSSRSPLSRNFPKVNQLATQSMEEAPQRMLHGFGCNLFSVGIGGDRIVCGGEEGIVRIWNFSQALEIEQRVQALRGIRLENRMRRRKLQMGMNGKGDQCSVAAKNQMNGNRSGSWHGRRGVSGKLKA